MSWRIHVVEKPDTVDAARIDAFVATSPLGHLYQYPLPGRSFYVTLTFQR